MIYTGIGARKTPSNKLDLMEQIAIKMVENNHILRSGHAEGADKAFEKGCDILHGDKEIYLPWPNFNGSKSKLYQLSNEAFNLAEKYHPAWDRLSQAGKKLMARNSYQLLGYDLNEPSNVVICWTPQSKITGGTGQVLRMANQFGIPVVNIADTKDDLVMDKLSKFFEITKIKTPKVITKNKPTII